MQSKGKKKKKKNQIHISKNSFLKLLLLLIKLNEGEQVIWKNSFDNNLSQIN